MMLDRIFSECAICEWALIFIPLRKEPRSCVRYTWVDQCYWFSSIGVICIIIHMYISRASILLLVVASQANSSQSYEGLEFERCLDVQKAVCSFTLFSAVTWHAHASASYSALFLCVHLKAENINKTIGIVVNTLSNILCLIFDLFYKNHQYWESPDYINITSE